MQVCCCTYNGENRQCHTIGSDHISITKWLSTEYLHSCTNKDSRTRVKKIQWNVSKTTDQVVKVCKVQTTNPSWEWNPNPKKERTREWLTPTGWLFEGDWLLMVPEWTLAMRLVIEQSFVLCPFILYIFADVRSSSCMITKPSSFKDQDAVFLVKATYICQRSEFLHWILLMWCYTRNTYSNTIVHTTTS